ncbi:hypothetical protein STENM36S_03917 [Streptomyces tendae]
MARRKPPHGRRLRLRRPELPGWHNPVDHPDYLAYLAERGLPPYEISDRVRGTLPNGGPGNLLAARLHQPVEATLQHYLATRAIERLEHYAADAHEQDRPFLALHFFGSHLPYILPDEYFDLVDPADVELPRSVSETFEGKPPVQRNYSAHWTFDTMPIETTRKLIAVYWGYVALIDRQIGRVMAAMERLGLVDDTAVFFTCDHGEFTGSHRLHDKGPAMYEDIFRHTRARPGYGAHPAVRCATSSSASSTAPPPSSNWRAWTLNPPSTRAACCPWCAARRWSGTRTSSASSTATTSPTPSACCARTAEGGRPVFCGRGRCGGSGVCSAMCRRGRWRWWCRIGCRG